MADHLTPDQLARIDAIVGPIHRERADAPGLAAKYDDACERIAEQHDEIVKLRRRAEALKGQLADARALVGRYWDNALAAMERRDAENNRLRLAWQSARRRARRQRDALREAMAADREQVRIVRDRYRDERDAARRENAALRAQLAATTNPARAEEQLAADARPGTDRSSR
ncbi:hypothetical protein NE857_31480 [Nocardiopsis exhalans]|uniref:Uncharacterized protein n=1 Tax=Nocardiopsis exhalans TaxID=163604 RepID=A0ABY5D7H9_9ACTN|nr:hypothetical protein [Nocardiopsis exhalans]USY19701.1 hypothetical protein NE857_31480 [Nocardiopsis exhalans]